MKKIKISPSVTREITPISGYVTWCKPAARIFIVSKDQFQDNCFKRNICSITPYFDALSYRCEYLLYRVVSANLVLVLSVRLLFQYTFKVVRNKKFENFKS